MLHVTDHECVLFNLSFNLDSLPSICVKCSRILNHLSAEKFSAAFNPSPVLSYHADVASLVHSCNTHSAAVFDKVTPSKLRLVPSVCSFPWVNDTVRCFRRKCQRVERLWKSTKLYVHRLYYKDLITEFNDMVKDARPSYFTKLISSSKCNPKILFDTINNIVTPAPPDVPIFSNNDWFVDKISDVRAGIIPSSNLFSAYPTWPWILDCFSPISLQDLTDPVGSMKLSSSPVLGSTGPCLISIINSSLQSGCFPAYFKHAVIQPLLKKLTLLHGCWPGPARRLTSHPSYFLSHQVQDSF